MPTASEPSDPDAGIESAFQEARDTLDVFMERIAAPHPSRTYIALEVRLAPPDGSPQDIWVAM